MLSALGGGVNAVLADLPDRIDPGPVPVQDFGAGLGDSVDVID